MVRSTGQASAEGEGDQAPMGGVLASSHTLMDPQPLRADPETPLKDIAKMMLDSGKSTVMVEKGGKLQGIVTPVHILKLLAREVSGIYVRVTGMQDEDDFIKTVVDEQLKNEVRKLAKVIPIDYMLLTVDVYEEDGKRHKYSIQGTLVTQKGHFFADDHAWDATKAVRGVLQKLEREVLKKKGKSETFVRGNVDHFIDSKRRRL
jgi:ribosome-associated translation inhibitor RaiA